MICKRCGHEIAEGNLYCEHCGAEVLLVPDFDELEEMLPTLVGDERERQSSEEAANRSDGILGWRRVLRKLPGAASTAAAKDGSGIGETTRSITNGVFVAVVIVFLAAVAVGLYFHSYTHAYGEGSRYDKMGQYDRAIAAYRQALDRRESAQAYLALGIDLTQTGEYADAKEALEAARRIDEENGALLATEIDRALASLYVETGDFDAIGVLLAATDDPARIAVLEEYYIRPPEFSEEGGSYGDDLELVLSSPDDYAIYYTTDGTDPTATNSTRYEEPIAIRSGSTTVKACCVNGRDIWGSIVTQTYRISYDAPSKPVATPAGGTYHEPVAVMLSVREENAVIYYTWDGTDPSKNSAVYTAPLELPEGESTLAAIAIDRHGMASGILRCSYTYIP